MIRDLESRMLSAVLGGDGLAGVAEIAAAEAGGPIAIVLPDRGLLAAAHWEGDLAPLGDYARAAISSNGPPAERPAEIAEELVVAIGEEEIGFVLALHGPGAEGPRLLLDRSAVLRAAALASLAALAAADARDEVTHELGGGLLEELRGGSISGADAERRAARLGCDLRFGAIALVAEIRTALPRQVAALVGGEWEGAIAEPLPGDPQRVYAILPSREGDDGRERLEAAVRRIAGRLRRHGPAAFSTFCPDPGGLHRAIGEAELICEVIAGDARLAAQLDDGIVNGVYRILFRALASDPEEVRRFYDETVAPLVDHDEQYRTELLDTLEAYLAEDCNMNATARTVYAHRHTVAHRLERIRELTGLDPGVSEDRERLGLGIKAHRLLIPTRR